MGRTEAGSVGGGLAAQVLSKFQLGSVDTSASAVGDSLLMLLLPDPNPAGGSDYITAGGDWQFEIEAYDRDQSLGIVYSQQVPQAADTAWVPLVTAGSPARFRYDDPAGSDGYLYRCRVKDQGGNIADEWDFRVFGTDFSGSGPSDLSDINDTIARIAGLLGYRQRVTYSNYVLGIPQDTLIELLNSSDAVIAEYNVKKILDDANGVIGEIHQWDASTYPGPIS